MTRIHRFTFVFALVLAGFVFLSPAVALADCATPVGVEGELIYNADYSVVQFCDGTNWIKLGGDTQDSRIGTLTNTKWCSSDGSSITCTQDPPAASAVGSDKQVIFNDGGSALAGAANLVWDKTFNTNAGGLTIGATSVPTQTLDVAGKATASSMIFKSVSGAAAPGGTASAGGSSGQVQFNDGTGLAGDGALVWDNTNKRLGIGTASPSALLHVNSASTGVKAIFQGAGDTAINTGNIVSIQASGTTNWGSLKFTDNATANAYIGYITGSAASTRLLGFANNSSTPQMVIDGSGKVGIGTASPGAALDVSTVGTANAVSYIRAIGTGDTNAAGLVLTNGDNTKEWQMTTRANSNDDLWFAGYNGSTWATTMILTQTGNVGIGMSPNGPKLHVSGSIAATGWVGAGCEVGCEVSGGYALMYADGTLSITSAAYKPGGGSWTDSSDLRLKSNIQPITGALDKISMLQGVNFDWRKPELHKNNPQAGGFIAQDVAKVFPEFILDNDCTEDECDLVPDGKVKTLSLPFKFDAYLVEAIKELKAENDALRARVEALEAKQ